MSEKEPSGASGAAEGARPSRSGAASLIELLRPKQWTKNIFVFAVLIFSHDLFVPRQVARAVLGFIVFCVISSAAYVFNDLMDREQDRHHPRKCRRPIASGRVSPLLAVVIFVALSLIGLASAAAIHYRFGIIAAVYLGINVGYSLYLKHVVILDVMILSSGFVLRLFSGAAILDVTMSSWFIICTILVSLFLGLGKRRQELVIMGDKAVRHRDVLKHYTPYFLDQMIAVVTASTLISYAIYTISEETVRKFHTQNLVLTLPFVLYGIFRYLYLIHRHGKGDSPTMLMLEDVPMMINSVLYIVTVIVVIYG
jgi:4-hydroxybenzoate polyprenyltransferase